MKRIAALITTVSITALVLFILSFNTHKDCATEAVMAINPDIEVLFELQMNRGNIVLFRTLGADELSLAFLARSFSGVEHIKSTTKQHVTALEAQTGLTYVVLPKSSGVPFTIYAGTTTNPDLAEILVTEPSFKIAHRIHLKESLVDDENLYVWMVASVDFTGEHFSIIGLAADGTIIGDIEYDGTSLTIHTTNTIEAR